MTPLTILLMIQETLPPPPTPTGSPEIDTAQVVGVVIISLALIMLGALAIRPMVARKLNPSESTTESGKEAAAPADPTAPQRGEAGTRSIIPFPKQMLTPATATDQPWAWSDSDGSIEDRFKRVIAESGRRRKLGDRQPNVPVTVAPTRIRTLASESSAVPQTRTSPLILSPIVPLNDRRSVAFTTERQSVAVAEPEIREPETNVQHSILTVESDTQIRNEPVMVGDSTEPFVLIRRAELEVEAAPPTGPSTVAADESTPVAAVQDWQAVIDQLEQAGQVQDRASDPVETDLVTTLPLEADTVDHLTEFDSGGVAPSDADLEREVVIPELVEVIEVQPAAAQFELDETTMAGITRTVRELIYCANAGKLINGFSLYSDPYLFRFMDSTGLDEVGFRERFSSIPPRPAHEWEQLDRLSDIVRRPDERIEATVSYIDNNGKVTNGQERFRFEYSVESGFWMIDDIQSL